MAAESCRVRRWACQRGRYTDQGSVGAVSVPAGFPLRGQAARLIGRRAERSALDRLLDAVRAGESRALVVYGEPGAGKTALLELPRGLTTAELAGGFGLPGALPLPHSAEDSFRRRVDGLPVETRRLMQLAAADPTGDPALMWRAAGWLGVGAEAARPATEAGLIEFGAQVRFRHPLVRSAAYRSASAAERREVHRSLAEATDPELDPDRRA